MIFSFLFKFFFNINQYLVFKFLAFEDFTQFSFYYSKWEKFQTHCQHNYISWEIWAQAQSRLLRYSFLLICNILCQSLSVQYWKEYLPLWDKNIAIHCIFTSLFLCYCSVYSFYWFYLSFYCSLRLHKLLIITTVQFSSLIFFFNLCYQLI